MTAAKLYYESHVTIDPPEDSQIALLTSLVQLENFRLAKLFMRKGGVDEAHVDDAFMTGHGKELSDIRARTIALVNRLHENGFVVRRYKIEDTVLDSRFDDELELLL